MFPLTSVLCPSNWQTPLNPDHHLHTMSGPHCKGTEHVLVGGWLKERGFKKDYLALQPTFHNLSSLYVDSRLFIPKLKEAATETINWLNICFPSHLKQVEAELQCSALMFIQVLLKWYAKFQHSTISRSGQKSVWWWWCWDQLYC